MSVFRIESASPRSAADAWRRVTDWPAHAAGVPLTRTDVLTPAPAGVGTRFVARTGWGPLAIEDPMVVVVWEPPADDRPGRCRVEKEGRVLTGWAEIEVAPVGTGSVTTWTEEVAVARLPAFLDPLVARSGRLVFGRALARLLRA